MLKEQQQIRVTIPYINEEGIADVLIQKEHLFLRHVLPKEEVLVKVGKRIKNGYTGEVIKILKPSPARLKPQCSSYAKCGSCQLLHVSYEEQLRLKKQAIIQMVKHSQVAHMKVCDVEGMAHPYQYRNKIIISFTKDRNHQMQAGFYEEFSHQMIPFQECLLHEDSANKIIRDIIALVKKLRIEPYEEDRRRGLLRHILIRRGFISNQTMVVLVVAANTFPARKNFVNELLKKHPEINTIIQNVNSRKTSVVLGDEERVLYGSGYIEDELCKLKFRISSKSFYQINHEQTEKLYEKTLSLVNWRGNETIIDAYSGIGTIGMCASKYVSQVMSVELNHDAVKDAIDNAKRNKITNVRFVCDDAGKYMQKLAMQKKHIDAVIIDPPRSGSDERFLSSLIKLKPRYIIYISCNPKTQIRDLEYLKRYGYLGNEMYLYDQFPQTFHVESIVLLSYNVTR